MNRLMDHVHGHLLNLLPWTEERPVAIADKRQNVYGARDKTGNCGLNGALDDENYANQEAT